MSRIFNVILQCVLLISYCLAQEQGVEEDLSSLYNIFSSSETPKTDEPNSPIDLDDGLKEIVNNVFNPPTDRPKDINTSEESCTCLPYYQCNVNGTYELYGTGLLDPRFNECDGALEKCCNSTDQKPPKITMRPEHEQKICGQRNEKGIGTRITNFKQNEAQFGEFPWMVAILADIIIPDGLEPIKRFQCGGAIVHSQIVLTVAHCAEYFRDNVTLLTIRAGEWDTQSTQELLPHQDRKARQIFIHENYHKGSLRNDFALVILQEPFNFGYENVGSICLPDANDNFDYQRCFVSGWGKESYGKQGKYSVILKSLELPVVPHDQCQKLYRKTRVGPHYLLDKSFTCAGGERGLDTCQGDGGSALACPMKDHPDKYVTAGLVSWGLGCGEAEQPGVYANIADGRKWIDEKVAMAGFNIYEYQAL